MMVNGVPVMNKEHVEISYEDTLNYIKTHANIKEIMLKGKLER